MKIETWKNEIIEIRKNTNFEKSKFEKMYILKNAT